MSQWRELRRRTICVWTIGGPDRAAGQPLKFHRDEGFENVEVQSDAPRSLDCRHRLCRPGRVRQQRVVALGRGRRSCYVAWAAICLKIFTRRFVTLIAWVTKWFMSAWRLAVRCKSGAQAPSAVFSPGKPRLDSPPVAFGPMERSSLEIEDSR